MTRSTRLALILLFPLVPQRLEIANAETDALTICSFNVKFVGLSELAENRSSPRSSKTVTPCWFKK